MWVLVKLSTDYHVETYQVVSEELHDQSGVLVALLAQCVKLCRSISTSEHRHISTLKIHTSNGIIKCLFSKMASLVGRVKDLVVEDGEVEC